MRKGEIIMKFTKSMKRRFKEERDVVFERMIAEENLQKRLREEIEESETEADRKEAKARYDRSIANWGQLNEHYVTYDVLASKQWFKVSPDTALTLGVGLFEIVLILYFEKVDIVTSKALNYVIRRKV